MKRYGYQLLTSFPVMTEILTVNLVWSYRQPIYLTHTPFKQRPYRNAYFQIHPPSTCHLSSMEENYEARQLELLSNLRKNIILFLEKNTCST